MNTAPHCVQTNNESLFIPKSVVLELTYKCNHHCLFCSCPWEASSEKGISYTREAELSLDQWKQGLDILHNIGVENLSISGGEALLCSYLPELLAYIREKNVFNTQSEIVLISNGLAMTDNFLELFKRYNVHLNMSLPGINTFAQHTGVDNAKDVLHWFRKAQHIGIHTTANVTVTKLNYYELFNTLATALISGAETILLNRFLPGGRGLSYIEELTLDRQQLNGMLDIAEQVLEYAQRTGSVGTEFPRCIIDNYKKYQRLYIGTLCAAAKDFFVIDPSGNIRVCNHSSHKVGSLFDTRIISDTKYWNIFTQRAYIPPSCTNCKEVSYCDCGCRETANIVTGNICNIDPCLSTLCSNNK